MVHGADDGGVHLVLSITEDILVRLLVLLGGLFELDGVDFDAEKLVGEVFVEMEHVSIQHVFSFRLLRYHTCPYLSICE